MDVSKLKSQIVRRVPQLRGVVLARTSLKDIGWTRSAEEGKPVDRDGRPLAWLTYPALHLLEQRTPADARVFEYGSGHSTLWWGARAAHVVSCEHDPEWAARIGRAAPPNTTLMHCPEPGRYVDAPSGFDPFDVVVIDGIERLRCATPAASALTQRGVIVWDNSDRPIYNDGFSALSSRGFRHLQLWGLAPGFDHWGSTSIFYRDGNCLGL